jgi:hypothetical protein
MAQLRPATQRGSNKGGPTKSRQCAGVLRNGHYAADTCGSDLNRLGAARGGNVHSDVDCFVVVGLGGRFASVGQQLVKLAVPPAVLARAARSSVSVSAAVLAHNCVSSAAVSVS